MLHTFIDWILATVHDWGYTGIFILMALESTVLPVPSELVLIPAGYLAHQGHMNLGWIMLASTAGCLAGASINYFFALWVGRPFLERWGRWFFVRPELLHKTDAFFAKHGAVSTFTGRLIPGIRHLISLPAGLTRMNLGAFARPHSVRLFPRRQRSPHPRISALHHRWRDSLRRRDHRRLRLVAAPQVTRP